jgi:hypothetical protein
VSAVFAAGHRIEGIIVTALGGKKGDVPPPAKPPEEGWFKQAQADQARKEAIARRWVSAHT